MKYAVMLGDGSNTALNNPVFLSKSTMGIF